MRRHTYLLAVAAWFFLVMACASRPPAPVPPPVPAPVCGDGTCDPGETPETCRTDCGAPPPVKAVCGDGKCDATQETVDSCKKDCLPPARTQDHSKYISYGIYTWANQSTADPEAAMRIVHDSGLNAFSVHGASTWGAECTEHWVEFDSKLKRFRHDRVNASYKKRIEDLFFYAAQNDVTIHWCFFDIYWTDSWMTKAAATGCNYHPFRNNDSGLQLRDWPQAWGNFPAWFSWGEDSKGKAISWTAKNPRFFKMVESYIDIVIDAYVRARRFYPQTARLWWRAVNEPREVYNVVKDPKDGKYHTVAGKTIGPKDALFLWIESKFKKAGINKYDDRFRYVDNWAFYRSDSLGTPFYLIYRINQPYIKDNGYMKEIHSIDDLSIAQKYIAAGVDPAVTIFSSDGTHDSSHFYNDMKILVRNVRNADLKQQDEPGCFDGRNFQKTLECTLPKMDRGIFK